ncbi:MAG: hypothetical protein LBP36_01350 [Oscillospiraceae bacterium]|nr:hypothetical protein [Oscillospiraceae bacterium]
MDWPTVISYSLTFASSAAGSFISYWSWWVPILTVCVSLLIIAVWWFISVLKYCRCPQRIGSG